MAGAGSCNHGRKSFDDIDLGTFWKRLSLCQTARVIDELVLLAQLLPGRPLPVEEGKFFCHLPSDARLFCQPWTQETWLSTSSEKVNYRPFSFRCLGQFSSPSHENQQGVVMLIRTSGSVAPTATRETAPGRGSEWSTRETWNKHTWSLAP